MDPEGYRFTVWWSRLGIADIARHELSLGEIGRRHFRETIIGKGCGAGRDFGHDRLKQASANVVAAVARQKRGVPGIKKMFLSMVSLGRVSIRDGVSPGRARVYFSDMRYGRGCNMMNRRRQLSTEHCGSYRQEADIGLYFLHATANTANVAGCKA